MTIRPCYVFWGGFFVPESPDEIEGKRRSISLSNNPLYAAIPITSFDEMAEALSTIRTP
mgnify:CR=1 FL=1